MKKYLLLIIAGITFSLSSCSQTPGEEAETTNIETIEATDAGSIHPDSAKTDSLTKANTTTGTTNGEKIGDTSSTTNPH
jgi:hypothetical protein